MIDIYSTRAQLAAVEAMPREYSFFYDNFCQEKGCVEDTKAIYDYRKGSQHMAPIVTNGAGSVIMERGGYETREIGFCEIAPSRVVSNQDLQGRVFGETILGAMTPEQRSKKLLAEDLSYLRKAIQLRREWMARQVMLTGKLDVYRYTSEGRDKETTLIADYGFTNNYTPATKWNASGANIDKDMQGIFDLVYDGGGYVDMILMAPNVAAAMIANDKYIKQFDGRNIDMGSINTKYKGAGIRFIGWNSDGVEMYSMSGKYLDDDGTRKDMMPSGKLVAGSKGMLNVYHGPVTLVTGSGDSAKHTTYIKKEVPKRSGNDITNVITQSIISCPTIVPENVDGWAVATVL